MKNFIVAIALLIISNLCFAQSDTIFFNADWNKCTRNQAKYYRLIIKNSKVDYSVTDYFISNNKPQMVGKFLALNPEQRNGPFIYYREDGTKEGQGVYQNERKIGQWIWWDEGGKDSSVAVYQTDGTVNWTRRSEEMINKDESELDKQVFISVEQMPVFPGGETAMLNFLSHNIKYPAEAIKEGIEGKVILQFVVNEDGSISSLKVLRDIGKGCADEAIRVVKLMPKWAAGKQNGHFVRVQLVLPIVFKLP